MFCPIEPGFGPNVICCIRVCAGNGFKDLTKLSIKANTYKQRFTQLSLLGRCIELHVVDSLTKTFYLTLTMTNLFLTPT